MSYERYYSVKPGEVILNSNEPLAVEYRRELMGYLNEYPKGKNPWYLSSLWQSPPGASRLD